MFVYRDKVGYYIDDPRWEWLGFEMEAYGRTPLDGDKAFLSVRRMEI